MFMGKQYNNNGAVNVNTKLYTSYSDACMITMGAWNLNLSLKFHPFKGVNEDGIRQYAQDNTEVISTSLTVDNTGALLEGIKEKIEPALKENKKDSVSVPIGNGDNRKMLTVATDENNTITLSIAIHVAENGTTSSENILTHVFNKKEYMAGYDPSTGQGQIVSTNADYKNFVKKLESIYDLAPAVSHSINYNNAVKSSYSNKQAANTQNVGNSGYSAPSTVFSGDMSDFLPMS